MLFILVLSSLLLISIIGIAALITYKIMCKECPRTENVPSGVFSNVLREKLAHIFERTHKKSTHVVFPKLRNIFNTVRKNISDRHSAFVDSMNGKGDTSQKGSASLFLKNVSEHKKLIHKDDR